MFNTSHILVLELKCAHSCSHTFLFKSSYYNDHEMIIINNLNFIKKPDSCKSEHIHAPIDLTQESN